MISKYKLQGTSHVFLKSAWRSIKSALYRLLVSAHKSIITRLIGALLVIFGILGIIIYFLERNSGSGITSPGEAYWWLIVVVTKAPGYPGVLPLTNAGRVVAFVLIIIGLSFIPIITARIATYMVTRRLREEKGLEKIKTRNHTIICGWNEHIKTVIEGITGGRSTAEVVLVNTAGPDKINEMLVGLDPSRIKYVHGDFTSETILNMANIRQATSVIVLADNLHPTSENTDDRVVLATLAVKTMNPKAWVCSEVSDQKTAPHASRAGANEVIVHGEHDPFLIASAATSEGVVLAARQLLSFREGNTLQQKPIPFDFIGKSFSDLAAFLKEKHDAILIGLYSLGKALRTEDILSADYSLIDDFIERKFKEAGKEYLSTRLEAPQVNLNPGDDYIIQRNDAAVVIIRRESSP